METLSRTIAWANYLLTWAWVLWFGIGIVVGGIMLARDEWRLHRTRPKPAEVSAYADDLINRYGREAFRINGDAMVAARDAKQFDRYRFLKAVSGALVSRLFCTSNASDRAACFDNVSAAVCFPGASPSPSEHQRQNHSTS